MRAFSSSSVSNVTGILVPAADPPPARWPMVATKASAGFPSPAGDYIVDDLDLNEFLVKNKPATFFIRFGGDSLTSLGILDQDVGGCDRSITPKEGKLVVASLDGDIVAKVYERVDGRWALTSRNRDVDYKPLFLDKVQESTIWGVVNSLARQM